MLAIILNFDRAKHVFLIQNESYQQSSEKMKNNGEYRRQYSSFFLLSSLTNAINYIHWLEIYIFRVFRPKFLWYGNCGKSQWVHSIFYNGKRIFPNSLINFQTFRKWNISIMYVKFKM